MYLSNVTFDFFFPLYFSNHTILLFFLFFFAFFYYFFFFFLFGVLVLFFFFFMKCKSIHNIFNKNIICYLLFLFFKSNKGMIVN